MGPGVDDEAEAPACDVPAQSTQKTTSQVSQNMSSDCEWRAHLGTTSRRCRPIRSNNYTPHVLPRIYIQDLEYRHGMS